MAEVRVVERMGKWWECLIAIALAVGFAFIIRAGLASKSPTVWAHVLIPLYGLSWFAILALLVDKRFLIVTRDGFTLGNGPIPTRGVTRIPRDQIAFCYFFTIEVRSDEGDRPVPIGSYTGIQTRAGRQVLSFVDYKSREEARAGANELARALNEGSLGPPIPVQENKAVREDPMETRRMWIRVGICGAALLAGVAWEIVYRWR